MSSEAELRDTITDLSNGTNPDANPVIVLQNDIALSATALAALNKPLTIDTNGFVLSGVDETNPGTSIAFEPSLPGGSLTITGDGGVEGGDTPVHGVSGGVGLALDGMTITNNGSITGGLHGHPQAQGQTFGGLGAGQGLTLTNGTLVNNGAITGGSGLLTAASGYGTVLTGGTGHVNNGIIQGGLAGKENFAQAGLAMDDTDLVNNGTIRGGGNYGSNADGVYMTGESMLTNSASGEIYGADGNDTYRGGDGLSVVDDVNVTIVNQGLIRGATTSSAGHAATSGISGLPGVAGPGFPPPPTAEGTIHVINSGTIAGGNAGNGELTAISMGGAFQLVLELNAGSVIDGAVETHASKTDDIFRLGGEADETFDVSAIGDAAQYRGFDVFEKTGASTWTITGLGTNQAAPWDIYAGTMLMSAGSDLGDGAVNVFGGTLAGIGIVGPTTNHAGGTIAPGIGGIGRLTVAGGYTSDGGALEIETVLGDDSSDTDLLFIDGNSMMGTGATRVFVTNLGGLGGQTVDGIKIVDVENGTSEAGVFALGGPAIGGAYLYDLFQGTPTIADGDWYLRTTDILAPTVPVYENYPIVMLGMTELPTLQQRVGDRYWPGAGGGGADFQADDAATGAPRNLWTRIEGAHRHVEGESTTGADYDGNRFLVQAGIDGLLAENGSGRLIGGLNAQYGRVNADISSDNGSGDASTDSYGVGATLTWYGNDGVYVDGQASVARLSSDLSADAAGELVDGNDGVGYAFSIEAGRKIGIGGSWSLTPQVQLAYASVDFDDFTDPFGATVSLDSGDSLKGRIGVALNHDAGSAESRSHVYGIANLTYEFLDGTAVDVAGVNVAFEPDAFGAELGLGGAYEWAGGKYALYGEALAQSSFEGSYGVKGTVGFSTTF